MEYVFLIYPDSTVERIPAAHTSEDEYLLWIKKLLGNPKMTTDSLSAPIIDTSGSIKILIDGDGKLKNPPEPLNILASHIYCPIFMSSLIRASGDVNRAIREVNNFDYIVGKAVVTKYTHEGTFIPFSEEDAEIVEKMLNLAL